MDKLSAAGVGGGAPPHVPPDESPITTGVVIAAALVGLGLVAFTYAMIARYVPGARGTLSERGAMKLICGTVAFTVLFAGTTIVIYSREKKRIEGDYIPLDSVPQDTTQHAILPTVGTIYDALLAETIEDQLMRVSGDVKINGGFAVDASRTPGLRALGQVSGMQAIKCSSAEFYNQAAQNNTVIVNITHPDDKNSNQSIDYTKSDIFKSEYSRQEDRQHGVVIFLHKSNLTKQCFFIPSWKENDVLDVERTKAYFAEAVSIAFKLKHTSNSTVFVHSKNGRERTATFLLMIELALDMFNNKIAKDSNNDRIRSEIVEILKDIAGKARERLPNRDQLNFLLSDKFIEAIKSVYFNV